MAFMGWAEPGIAGRAPLSSASAHLDDRSVLERQVCEVQYNLQAFCSALRRAGYQLDILGQGMA